MCPYGAGLRERREACVSFKGEIERELLITRELGGTEESKAAVTTEREGL